MQCDLVTFHPAISWVKVSYGSARVATSSVVCSFVVVASNSGVFSYLLRSVQDAAFIHWYHVLNVDEGVFTTVCFEDFKGLLDQITQVALLSLRVVNLVSQVHVLRLVQIKYGQDLAVVRDEGLTNSV